MNHANVLKIFLKYDIYSFDFDFNSQDKLHFLKTIYPKLKEDVDNKLIYIKKENLIIELQKDLFSVKISEF